MSYDSLSELLSFLMDDVLFNKTIAYDALIIIVKVLDGQCDIGVKGHGQSYV